MLSMFVSCICIVVQSFDCAHDGEHAEPLKNPASSGAVNALEFELSHSHGITASRKEDDNDIKEEISIHY